MTEISPTVYENPFGKSRLITPESKQFSLIRREYFNQLSPELLKRLDEKGVQGVGFEITGSVAKDAATPESDIDVRIKYPKDKVGDRMVDAAIRNSLQSYMTDNKLEKLPFHIDFKSNPADTVLNPVALLKLAARAAGGK